MADPGIGGYGMGANMSHIPTSKVELHIRCRDLPNLDTFSKSDPFVVVSSKTDSGKWVEIGRTETIQDDLNPDFVTSFTLDYMFEVNQDLMFAVYDRDGKDERISSHDFIGSRQWTLGQIVGSRGQQVTAQLASASKSTGLGTITVHAEELHDMNVDIRFQFACKKLDKKDFMGKSDPYVLIKRSRIEDEAFVPVYQTETVKKNLNPTFAPFTISYSKLCNGDGARPLLFEVWDWNKRGDPDFIGSVTLTMDQIERAAIKDFELINAAKKKKKRKYKNSGTLRIVGFEKIRIDSFLDFIAGGCEVSLTAAIDFTASNGDPRYSNSLHYRSPYQSNSYEMAITAVGQILAPYDSDGLYPIMGFGARLPPNNQVSHCFALNGNELEPEVVGVEGMIEAYRAALDNVSLYGPTNFAGIIGAAAERASQHVSQANQQYHILLIITDGEITDMLQTKAAIVRASALPLSIVIVGVGEADFANMELLDGDDVVLQANGRTAEADIVQFVAMRDFHASHPSALAAAVLEEIPGQMLGYFKRKGIHPNEPIPPPSYNAVAVADGPPPPAFVDDAPPPAFVDNTPPPAFVDDASPGPSPSGTQPGGPPAY